LVETFGARGFEPGLLELFDGEGLCLAKSFASRIAAFQRIIGELAAASKNVTSVTALRDMSVASRIVNQT